MALVRASISHGGEIYNMLAWDTLDLDSIRLHRQVRVAPVARAGVAFFIKTDGCYGMDSIVAAG